GVPDEQGEFHSQQPGDGNPPPARRRWEHGQKWWRQHGCLGMAPSVGCAHDGLPHLVEWRAVELGMQRRLGELSGDALMRGDGRGTGRAQCEVGLYEQTRRDVSLAADVAAELVRGRMRHDRSARWKKARSVSTAACTRDFTVPRGTLKALAASEKVRPLS